MPEDEISRGNRRAVREAHVLQYLLSTEQTSGDTSWILMGIIFEINKSLLVIRNDFFTIFIQ